MRTHSNDGTRLFTFLSAFLRLAFVSIDNGNTREFVRLCCLTCKCLITERCVCVCVFVFVFGGVREVRFAVCDSTQPDPTNGAATAAELEIE